MRLAASLGLALLSLSALPAPAAAQAPGVADVFLVSVNVDDVPMKEVPYLGQVTFQCSLEDLSRDATSETQGSETGLPHQTVITVDVLPYAHGDENGTANLTRPVGWSTGGATTINSYGGQVVPFTIQVKTSGAVEENYVRVRIRATMYNLVDGTQVTDEEHVVVKLAPFYAGQILMRAAPPRAGQFDTITYPVELRNLNTYPDGFLLETDAPDGWFASIAPRVVLGPREVRVVNLTVVTPHAKLWEFGTTGTVFVSMRSESDPKVVYSAPATITVAGPYVPTYWIPITLLGLAASGVLAGRARERAALRRGEKGLPRRPEPTPREAALLAELKRRDPEAYKAKMAQLAALHKARRELWKARRKEELAEEREEARRSRAEAKERKRKEKELRKARRKLDKAKAAAERKDRALRRKEESAAAAAQEKAAKADRQAEKAAKKAAKKQAKIDAKREKIEAKQRAKLEKQLAKRRKELERAARKAAKKR